MTNLSQHDRWLWRTTLVFLLFIAFSRIGYPSCRHPHLTIIADRDQLITTDIQQAIDSCGKVGGGIVRFPAGKYISGTIELKSNVTLIFEKDAVLTGSDKYSDYRNDAFIFGKDLTGIRIEGSGIIDGVDCYNPNGEEGFRGPHCIKLINCKTIVLKQFTIRNSANWAVNCRYCSNAEITGVTIKGGHDGIHTRFCSGFVISDCDIRTGDDAFAGNDNSNFIVSGCKINSSCNGFRMGCMNLKVLHCTIWGPGEYMHKIQKRNNMLSAFVHFSPKDENPKQKSGNWIIKDVVIRGADNVYIYNFENGLWQTGQPVTNVTCENLIATDILNSFNITGDSAKLFNLQIKHSSFSYRQDQSGNKHLYEGQKFLSPALFNISKFNKLELIDVQINNNGENPLFSCQSGNLVIVRDVILKTGN